ncbi:MAG TPA: radical SAM protein, partial [Woeseiaceae bacterium]|nr:radical SAM protein [Woeseiaceae bacterium]
MIPDSLISSTIRDISRHYLSFGTASDDVNLPAPAADRGYLLYLHIPFCVVLCPFCSFHRVEFRQPRAQAYFAALRREIRLATDLGYRFTELYVGGGTPTVMPDELLETVKLVRELHPMRRMSTETNPDDLGNDALKKLREA